jgi:hypothetical protein
VAIASLKDLLLEQKVKGAVRKGISAARKAGKSRSDAVRCAETATRERLRTDILGLVLTWTDTNPLGDDGCNGLPDAVSHNPSSLVRKGVVDAFQEQGYRAWMVSQEFTWQVDIDLVYLLPNNKTKSRRIDPIFFVQRGKMEDSTDNLSAINCRIEKAVYRISCVGL